MGLLSVILSLIRMKQSSISEGKLSFPFIDVLHCHLWCRQLVFFLFFFRSTVELPRQAGAGSWCKVCSNQFFFLIFELDLGTNDRYIFNMVLSDYLPLLCLHCTKFAISAHAHVYVCVCVGIQSMETSSGWFRWILWAKCKDWDYLIEFIT